ncbi:MAG: putative toxin-antitoxin system toxin component, PIN family [Lachnospiraceae bacterium]|nr:putative toxin-antitoxin system toxin component, PIN family [Lachnospiraceae bacterium]
MKIVIDTNAISSAIYFGGRPKELIEHLVYRRLDAYASTEIVCEYRETIEELSERYPNRPNIIPLADILFAMKMVEPTTHVNICRDPDDNKFIDCAIDGECVYVVSGDKDLLSLEAYEDIEIVTVSEFLTKYF